MSSPSRTGGRRATAVAVLVLAVACGGRGQEAGDGQAGRPRITRAPRSALTTVPPPEGVETFAVETGHVAAGGTVVYDHNPPVGGLHDAATWQRCAYYDEPVPSELAVHSLEHGAIWITFRPDLAENEKDRLAELARSRGGILVSRWDESLPAPIVASAWGRQLKLESATDPRLVQFILAFSGKSPEPLGSCD